MNNLLLFVLIFLIVLFIFSILNMMIKNKRENFGVYCGTYNINMATAQKNCTADQECKWVTYKDPTTKKVNSWCTNTVSKEIIATNMFGFLGEIEEDISKFKPSWTFSPSNNNWYTLSKSNKIGNWSLTNISSSSFMTASFWINITSLTNTWVNIFHLCNQKDDFSQLGGRVPALFIGPNSTTLYVSNDLKNGNKDQRIASSGININQSTFVVVSWNNDTVNIYINGYSSQKYTYPSQFVNALPTATLYVPAPDSWNPGNSQGNVQIKNFYLFNYVLNDTEIVLLSGDD